MKRIFTLSLLLFFLSLSSLSALTIKFGSLFPEGSTWDHTLKKMAREWSEITDGRVKLKIYPGGIAGSEDDMVRKMRIGQLDAAVLTSLGMTKIVPDSLILTLPFLVRNEAELDYAINEILPMFDEEFRNKGFELMVWSKSGWINFFSNTPVYTPDDLRKTRVAVAPNSPEMIEAFKALDFKIIPLGMNDTLMGLQSGMIDSYYSIPMAAAQYQFFALSPYLNPIQMSPVIGGIVLSQKAWRKIPAKYHEELKASIAAVESEFYNETERLNAEAMKIMKQNGLTVLDTNASHEQAWRDLFKDGYWMIVGDGKAISEKSYLDIVNRLETFRKNQ